MADYNITFPDGSPHTVQTGTIDNTYDVPLVGQDAINYGDDFATAYIRLLSNFANTSAPSFGTSRVTGQLWYDTTALTGGLNVYDGTSWDKIALESGVVTLSTAQSISGTKTFSAAPDFTSGGSPFTVNSTTLVDNLNAELLNGNASTAFATAAQGTLADNAEPDLGNPPSNGYVLSSTTGGTRSWVSPAVGTGNVDPADIGGAASPATMSVLLTDDPTGDQQPFTDSGLTFNGTTNTLTTTTFVGSLTGNADTATLATTATTATAATTVTLTNEASDTTTFVTFANTATGDQQIHTNAGLAFNSNTATLTATNLAGAGANITALNMNNATSGTLAFTRGGTGVNSSTGSGNNVLSASPTLSGTVVIPTINNSSGVNIQYNGSSVLGTQDRTASDNTSGAYVRDAGGTNRDVGFNQMDTTDFASSAGVTLFDRDSAGHSYRSTHSSGTKIYQTEAALSDTDIPNGAMWIVRNLSTSTGVVNIQAGAGAITIAHYSGSGTSPLESTNVSDPFVLARGGVATILKVADGEYEMWGIGITGGA